jgi:CheY-like chemotaxis protein
MNDVVLDLQDMLRRLIGEDVVLEKRIALQSCTVSADRGQIEQVLLNLVINARDAMPDGGTIVIETQDVVLDDEYVSSHPDAGTGQFAALVVSDTGTGISDDARAHIFEPFFTTKEPGKGTGLGLATCYGIATQYGGHIGVYSEAGVGTTMKLYLPCVAEPATAVRPRAPQANLERGTETILLVEDEAQVRAIVARMLAAQGYTVMQAANGEAALELLASATAPIDLLLTDLIMPRMGGRELAERVRALRPQLKVLFTSGYTEDAIVQNRLLDHDIVLLHKPFTRASLAAKVRETLDAPFRAA